MCIYIHTHRYVYVYILILYISKYINIYIYTHRERERDLEMVHVLSYQNVELIIQSGLSQMPLVPGDERHVRSVHVRQRRRWVLKKNGFMASFSSV